MGGASSRASRSAPSCSTASSPTSTAPQTLLRERRCCRRRWSSAIRGFLRPCARHRAAAAGAPAALYAADLARAPDGRWWVVGDRTQAPSGAGYALENRIVVSRVFPQIVPRLHGAAPRRRSSARCATRCAHWAPRPARRAARIVLLTPGPYNETYFEHAFLARYLGFTLVEGSDLTVRDDRVWLKTLDGLRARRTSILRRLDDDYCDPLELRADSRARRAGLVDCARRGNGADRQRARPRRARDPARCSASCRALARAAARRAAAAALGGDLVVRRAAPRSRTLAPARPAGHQAARALAAASVGRSFGADLSTDERRRCCARASRRGRSTYVAQERVQLSQAPVLRTARVARRARARAPSACACSRCATPERLARHAGRPDARRRATRTRASSRCSAAAARKDTWVLSDGPGQRRRSRCSRRRVGADDLVGADATSPSRAAENLFWFGRYGERCDATARLLRVAIARRARRRPRHAATASAPACDCSPSGIGRSIEPSRSAARALRRAATHPKARSRSACASCSRVAFSLRDRMSVDNWRTLNRLLADPALQREPALPLTLGLARPRDHGDDDARPASCSTA